MNHCDHCGTKCKRRHAVVIDGAVAMVGSSCVRRFPVAKPSDLVRSIDAAKIKKTVVKPHMRKSPLHELHELSLIHI